VHPAVPQIADVEALDVDERDRVSSWRVFEMWLRPSTSSATQRPGSRLSHQAVTR